MVTRAALMVPNSGPAPAETSVLVSAVLALFLSGLMRILFEAGFSAAGYPKPWYVALVGPRIGLFRVLP